MTTHDEDDGACGHCKSFPNEKTIEVLLFSHGASVVSLSVLCHQNTIDFFLAGVRGYRCGGIFRYMSTIHMENGLIVQCFVAEWHA